MNFKDWWEHHKSEYFYSEEDLAEDAYVAGYREKQAELVSAQARIAEVRKAALLEAADKCMAKHVNGNWKFDTRYECADAIRSMAEGEK